MGACQGKATDPRHKEIEKNLKEDRRAWELELKLLLLGAGQSGKSTIAKQFRIINIGDYTKDELFEYKQGMIENILAAIKALVQACLEKDIPIAPELSESVEKIKTCNKTTAILADYKDDIKKLWADKGIRTAFEREKEFQLNDNASYVLDAIDRAASPDYTPTQEDVLKIRLRTTGVAEIKFPIEDFTMKLVDVGGQRAERRKWMSCFDDVSAVLFCVAMSEYDQRLLEDDETNRTEESMKVFSEATTKWFPKTTIILFLNKKDLFQEKIKVSPLTCIFPDYEGPPEFEPAAEFFRDKFISLDPNGRENRLYTHFTCATDTESVRVVFKAVADTLLKSHLRSAGVI